MPRPSTPPPTAGPSQAVVSPPTPEVTRRIEENRLKAKALRERYDAALRSKGEGLSSSARQPAAGIIETDQIHIPNTRKRNQAAMSSAPIPSTSRDGRANGASTPNNDGRGPESSAKRPRKENNTETLRPARNFTKFVDYDFDKITDTKGGFLTAEDDPWNKAMGGGLSGAGKSKGGPNDPTDSNQSQQERPEGMSAGEWERLQLIRKLQRQKMGKFEPGISSMPGNDRERKKCRECKSLEIDFVWEEVFACAVCNKCKEAQPEKYSLLTKTECKDDYLLTDPELRDEDLLKHLSKPNPHKSHWHDMWLFLRYQVEEYVFSDKKWGSPETLDEEFQRREGDKKKRKETKFRTKLQDLKKRTRVDAYRRQQGRLGDGGGGGGKAKFGDAVATGGRHVHEWGRLIEREDGMSVKTCSTCGMEVEEMEF